MNADCPSRVVLELIADKWAVLVISAIAEGHHRNGELMRRIGGISQKALTRSLRDLERDGLIHRHDHGQIPPRVDYTLTPTGRSLQPVLAALCAWAIDHMDEVNSARRTRLRHTSAARPAKRDEGLLDPGAVAGR